MTAVSYNIESVNSSGLAEWLGFLAQARQGCDLLLDRCSPAMVNCFNMAPAAVASVKVRSVIVPLGCPSGHHEPAVLALSGDGVPEYDAAQPCKRCGEVLQPAVALADYLEFCAT